MRTLALDATTGDLSLAAGALSVVDGLAAIQQKLEVRLKFWRGEWFADASVGAMDAALLGVKETDSLLETRLRDAILTCPGIVALDEFSLVLGSDRVARVTFRARATDGLVVDVTDYVVGAS